MDTNTTAARYAARRAHLTERLELARRQHNRMTEALILEELAQLDAEELDTPEACPVTGRSATACEDPTHAGCIAGHAASVALDRVVEAQLDELPVHQRPTSCHVCGSAAGATGRPTCSHDWTNAEAFAAADEHDRRTVVTYSTGQHNAEAAYVDDTRGR